jgi:outer membrane protein TolC
MRFELGSVNNRDLLSSQDALGREEITLYSAIVNYNIALAQYNYACSMLLEKCNINVTEHGASIQ